MRRNPIPDEAVSEEDDGARIKFMQALLDFGEEWIIEVDDCNDDLFYSINPIVDHEFAVALTEGEKHALNLERELSCIGMINEANKDVILRTCGNEQAQTLGISPSTLEEIIYSLAILKSIEVPVGMSAPLEQTREAKIARFRAIANLFSEENEAPLPHNKDEPCRASGSRRSWKNQLNIPERSKIN
jgi:hypothetical protein